MPLRMWTLDIAREQCPTLDHLYQFASESLDAGYDSLGLYLEHRYAYPSTPWAHGKACVTPDMVASLRSEFPSLQIVPFINLLGHMEGFLNCEQGTQFRETPFRGMQGCPSNSDFNALCNGLLEDTLSGFDSEIIHLGGDETWELGKCPQCSKRDPATIYADHFGPLVDRVVAAGRRPALWGDMFLQYPEALNSISTEALIFDWQYFGGVKETTPKLSAKGHRVVACPTLHVYDAAWMHLDASETNIREVSQDARDLDLEGVCLTTWESGLFGAYDSILPAVKQAKTLMDDPKAPQGLINGYGDDSTWARLMGSDLTELGGVFTHDGHRHRLKSRLLLYGNPFLAWMHHGQELAGEAGQRALDICDRAILATQREDLKGAAFFVRLAVEFVRMAEAAHQWYIQDEPEKAIKALAPCRHAFETLETVARRTHTRIGGSLADIERCRVAKDHVAKVILRLSHFGRGELGYKPSFDSLTHPHFVPQDQANWWGVNRWGDE